MPSPRWIRRTLVAGVLALGLASCGSDSSPTEAAGAGADEVPAAGFVPTAAGGQIDIGALEGTDTVLWFWAPW